MKNTFFLLFLLVTLSECNSVAQDTGGPANEGNHPFLSKMDSMLTKFMNEHKVPGAAMALIEDFEVKVMKGYGTQTAGKVVPITPQTGFNIGSITKVYTAWGVMKQIEKGRINLDDPVFDHISRWKLGRTAYDQKEITISRLLSHTSGIYGDGVSDWKPEDKLPPIEKSLSGMAGARAVQLRWKPGTRWSYANGGYSLLQLLLMELEGRDFEDYMQEEIIDPLGLKHTSFALTKDILDNLTTPHHPKDQPTYVVHRTVTATGGLHTTLESLAQFLLASIDANGRRAGRGVLSPETLKEMIKAQPVTNSGWGLGYSIKNYAPGRNIIGHNGGAWGWISDAWMDPVSGNGYILLNNSTNATGYADDIFVTWMRWLATDIDWGSTVVKPAPSNQAFVGTWEGTITKPGTLIAEISINIFEEDGKLNSNYTTTKSKSANPITILSLSKDNFHLIFDRFQGHMFATSVSDKEISGYYYQNGRVDFELKKKSN